MHNNNNNNYYYYYLLIIIIMMMMAWDVTVVSTLAQSYVDRAATGVGMVAGLAAERKLIKYSNLPTDLIFQPIAQTLTRPLVIKPAVCVVGRGKRNFILVPASVCGIATIQCSSSARHLRVLGRSGPIAIAALFLLLLTLGNYAPKGIK